MRVCIFFIAAYTAKSPIPKAIEKFNWPKSWDECTLLPLTESSGDYEGKC